MKLKHVLVMPMVITLTIVILGLSPKAAAQDSNDPNANNPDALPAKFAEMTREISGVCGEFLPNQIQGVTELMPLCGARMGFKIGTNTFLEPQAVAGASKGQGYLLGSLSFRGDFQLDDFTGAFYGGADVHYVTAPVYDPTSNIATSSTTNVYFGVHLGGALWWAFSDNFYFRTDLQFNLNPGTSLFLGFSLVLRFDPQTGQELSTAPN